MCRLGSVLKVGVNLTALVADQQGGQAQEVAEIGEYSREAVINSLYFAILAASLLGSARVNPLEG
jgi:hypothetical protein